MHRVHSWEWRPIDQTAKDTALIEGGIAMGMLVEVRLGERQARARWRLPVTVYDVANDQLVKRAGVWWSERYEPLGFEPTEYRMLD